MSTKVKGNLLVAPAEKFRLELHWDQVKHTDRTALLKGAYFCGPVLKDTAKIQENDSLILDMTRQHLVFIPEYYQATLSWKQVVYQDDKIFLPGAKIIGKHVNSIETLQDTDWILIDCYGHDEARHPYLLVYFSKVMKKEGGDKY